jgi:hypothetical protein
MSSVTNKTSIKRISEYVIKKIIHFIGYHLGVIVDIIENIFIQSLFKW